MPGYQLYDLLRATLPDEISPDTIRALGKESWWKDNPQMACAYALRKSKVINWQEYLEHYPDVKASGIDPVWHFIKDGIFEGRKIIANNVTFSTPINNKLEKQPLVSVIITNYNKSNYIEYCINSVLQQTLPDIEIIIVDDASNDNSCDIINNSAKYDKRIRVYNFDKRQSQHMARKFGVAAAKGRYCMFLDSDDYYVPDACEKAFCAINNKYDFVCFNMKLLPSQMCSCQKINEMESYVNRGKSGCFCKNEILPALYIDFHLSDILVNKIFKSDICKHSFAIMQDGYMPRNQDIYEMLVLASHANNALKINDRLYVYRNHIGISTPLNTAESANNFAATGVAYQAIKSFLTKTGQLEYLPAFLHSLSINALSAWWNFDDSINVRSYFDEIANKFGILDLLSVMIDNYSTDWSMIAQKIKKCGMSSINSTNINNIGILYTTLGNGGAERVIRDLIELLIKKGFKVTIFLESCNINDATLPRETQIVYLGCSGQGINYNKSILTGLYMMLKHHPIDVLLYHAWINKDVLWNLILLKYLNIPTILFQHSSFSYQLIQKESKYNFSDELAIAACADAVSVLSRAEELLYRAQGINASFIPNPVRLPELLSTLEDKTDYAKNNIAVFGRFADETKNINECVRILAILKKRIPNIKMTFIGSFREHNNYHKFIDLADYLYVRKNIVLTGWLDNPFPILDQTDLLLSTSWSESFSLTIVEAQARGLPVVMYDMPIDPAHNNDSIIRFAHGSRVQMADKIEELLTDRAYYNRLSKLAIKNAYKYSGEKYVNNIINLINSFSRSSSLEHYANDEWRSVIKALVFYGGHLSPCQK